MEEEIVNNEVVETTETSEVPEIVYEYQATDENGRPLGAKQVFKGKTQQEIMDKIADANKNLIRLNRDLNKKYRLGELAPEEAVPETAERLDREAVEFRPRQLTDEERFQLSKDLLDPEKFDEASDRMFEAKIGASPKRITEVLSHAQEDIAAMRAEKEAKLFVQANPDYYVCPENFKTMVNWMIKMQLAPNRDNFQLAFDRLKSIGLLIEAPIVREDKPEVAEVTNATTVTLANSQQEPETVSRITNVEPQTQTKRTPRVASGLTRDSASDVGTISKSVKLSVAEIEKMTSAEYKRRLLTEPGFKKLVDEAYAA
jgi:hypothetical protein